MGLLVPGARPCRRPCPAPAGSSPQPPRGHLHEARCPPTLGVPSGDSRVVSPEGLEEGAEPGACKGLGSFLCSEADARGPGGVSRKGLRPEANVGSLLGAEWATLGAEESHVRPLRTAEENPEGSARRGGTGQKQCEEVTLRVRAGTSPGQGTVGTAAELGFPSGAGDQAAAHTTTGCAAWRARGWAGGRGPVEKPRTLLGVLRPCPGPAMTQLHKFQLKPPFLEETVTEPASQ